MARNQASGMKEYVRSQNNMPHLPKVDGSNENRAVKRMKSNPELEINDLKVHPNAPQCNVKAIAANGSAKVAPEGRLNASIATDRRPQHVPAGWETDASNADKSSTAESIVPAQRNQQVETHTNQSRTFHREFDPNEVRDELELKQNFGHNSHDEFSMHMTERKLKFFNLPRVQGDSYPDTTSGRPTEVDPQEMQHATRAYPPENQLPIGVMRTRGHPGSRAVNTVFAQQGVSRPVFTAPAAVDGNADTSAEKGFKFGKAPQMGKSNQKQAEGAVTNAAMQPIPEQAHRQYAQPQPMRNQLDNQRPPTRQDPHVLQANRAAVAVHTNTTLRTSKAHDGYSSPCPSHRPDSPHDHTVPARELPPHQFHGQAYGQQNDGALQHGPHAPTSDGVHHQHMHEDISRSEQPASEEDALDYDSETIVAMGYDQLRSVPTDRDPRAIGFDHADVQQAGSLPEKLRIVQTLDRQGQFDFFRSLELHQWEDAGDILVQRFGELVAKFKDGRKQKRKAAQAFEDEIEQRHIAVSKKTDIMKKAMQDMKKSGGQVLLSTPKKRKTVASAAKQDAPKK